MWLFDSKLHETFPVITIDRGWCETHETSFINIAQIYIYIYFEKGYHVNKAFYPNSSWARFHTFDFDFFNTTWSVMFELKPTANWWQTPGVLQPSPLKRISSRDSGQKTFKGRETCHPVSNISDSIRLLNFEVSERLIWSWHFLILALRRKLLSEEFLSLASIKHCYIGRNPR